MDILVFILKAEFSDGVHKMETSHKKNGSGVSRYTSKSSNKDSFSNDPTLNCKKLN